MPLPPAECPTCGERRLIEWDPVMRQWFCVVCAKAWKETRPAITG
jgi:hypothetical protein